MPGGWRLLKVEFTESASFSALVTLSSVSGADDRPRSTVWAASCALARSLVTAMDVCTATEENYRSGRLGFRSGA
jgi:hypothetical protein